MLHTAKNVLILNFVMGEFIFIKAMKNKNNFKYLTNKEKKAVLELKKEILRINSDAKIIFYGSKLTGNFDKESDIDLLIIIPGLKNTLKDKIIDLATDIELKYDVVFGLIIISEEKFKKSTLFKGSLFYENIKKEGIVI